MADETKKEPGGGDRARIGGTLLLIVVLGFIAAYQFVGPPPPKELVLATGVEGGGYHAYGERYRTALAESGIELRLLPTAGAVANFDALRAGEADIALVQGGTAPEDAPAFAAGVGSVFQEPLWIFHRADLDLGQLPELVGARIEVGREGSGTRAVALQLLAANGVTEESATLLASSTEEAANALLDGSVDAALFVTSPDADVITRLMAEESRSVGLLDVERHLAYVRLFPFLSNVRLAQGVLGLSDNVPDRDIELVAPMAALVASSELHPALVPLLLQVAEDVHGAGGTFAPPGSFPSSANLELPLSRAAEQYFAKGPSFLYRVFPFAVAATLDRLKIMLLPLLTLLLPLIRLAPPLLQWRTRRKIYRWYAHLDRIEASARNDEKAALARLDAVERDVRETVDVPASYKEELHNLRMHIENVRARLGA